MEKVFLIDGHAQIFRMYYAYMRRPLINSKGVDTSILFGFTKMLLELLKKEEPTHLAVAFDPPAKTFRHSAFPDYKANRSAAPELVVASLEPLQDILDAFRIPVVMMPGFEADDVIGSMATQWADPAKRNIYMVTPDKDYGQIIAPGVFQYKPAKGGAEMEIIGPDEICAIFGIAKPEQVREILTIWGDASDNVPGAKGIGEVGAKKLVGKYGTMEAIYEHLDELTPKVRSSLEEFRAQMPMSRFLVTIKRDIELPCKLEETAVRSPRVCDIERIFSKYEFASLRKMLPPCVETGGEDVDRAYREVVDGTRREDVGAGYRQVVGAIKEVVECSFKEVVEAARESGAVAVSLPEGLQGKLLLAAESSKQQKLLWTAISGGESDAMMSDEGRSLACDVVRSLMLDGGVCKVGYNLKGLVKMFLPERIQGTLMDIEIMHYLLNPEMSHKEEFLLKSYLGYSFDEHIQQEEGAPDLFSSLETQSDDSESILRRGEECAMLLPLAQVLEAELERSAEAQLYRKVEMPLIEVLANMEQSGVKLDIGRLKEQSVKLTAELAAIEDDIREQTGESGINLSSPKQVGVLLYEKLKISPKVKKSAKGSYPTDEETLLSFADVSPVVGKILEFRAVKKLLSTYVDNLPGMVSRDGKLHTTFNQALTATGRLSSNNPNLQNIPIRTKRGREIRRAFVPSDSDGYIVSADYSQIELRLMAHMSADSHFVEAFKSGMDIHTATAAKVFKVSEQEVTKEQRSRAKTANFGIIYGISAFGLSQRLGMSRTDSKELIEEYFHNYPGIKEYMNSTIANGREQGYVETIYGRKRYLPDINSRNANVRSFNERNAINAPLQGSAADIIKVAMIRLFAELGRRGLKSRLILQVHDELILDVPAGELEQVCALVKEVMETVTELKVPLVAECGYGKDWLQAH